MLLLLQNNVLRIVKFESHTKLCTQLEQFVQDCQRKPLLSCINKNLCYTIQGDNDTYCFPNNIEIVLKANL